MRAGAPEVPFLDLSGVHADLWEELDLSWKSVLAHGQFVGGPEVGRFERDFAEYCGVTDCVGVANGTEALELVLLALGVRQGDEVIVPANTFVATAEAVCSVGARPRFVDVERARCCSTPTPWRRASTTAPWPSSGCTCSARWSRCPGSRRWPRGTGWR